MGSGGQEQKQRMAHAVWPGVTDRLDPVPGTIRPVMEVVIGPLGNSNRAELRSPHSIILKNWDQVFLPSYLHCSTL